MNIRLIETKREIEREREARIIKIGDQFRWEALIHLISYSQYRTNNRYNRLRRHVICIQLLIDGSAGCFVSAKNCLLLGSFCQGDIYINEDRDYLLRIKADRKRTTISSMQVVAFAVSDSQL